MEPVERETLTMGEVARRLGIGMNSAYRLARAGVIPVLRVGRRLLVPRRALEKVLADPTRRQRAQRA